MDERKLSILGAIVEDYVATLEPVGSKSLLERHDLGVSAATVRNDMSVLEDEGLIMQPHTSAGRIPTHKGYRVFVDHVARIKPLSAPEKRAIHTFIDGAHDLDDLLSRTVRLLAQLTNQVAMVQYPALRQARVRHIELVKVAESLLLVVLITDAGVVDQHTLTLRHPRDAEFYEALRVALNRIAPGTPVTEVAPHLDALLEHTRPDDVEATAEVLLAVRSLLASRRQDKVVVAGAANLARGARFSHEVGSMLDVLEEQLVLLRLLREVHADTGEVDVLIGDELAHAAESDSFSRAAMVGSSYTDGSTGEVPSSRIAILGPSRMDYATSMRSVSAVARYISRFMA